MTMKIEVIRTDFSSTATIGSLLIDGEFFCYTLEDVVRETGAKVPGKTAIPYGVYEVIINMSSRFQKEMPLLLNVPGFAGIRIHPGNTDVDTDGCILVGNRKQTNRILNSKVTYNLLFQKMKLSLLNNEKISLELKKGVQVNYIA